MKMIKKFTLILLVPMLMAQTSLQASFLSQAERALFDYLSILVSASIVTNGSYVDPWIVCKATSNGYDDFRGELFMSSPLLKQNGPDMLEIRIFGWIGELLELGEGFQVRRGICRYRFESFGECLSYGKFSVTFDNSRITFFEVIKKPTDCSGQ